MRLKENKVYFKAGVTAFLVIAAGILCWFLIDRMDQVSGAFNKVMAILRPFIIGGALAYLLAPACNALDRAFLGWTRGRAEKLCKGLSIAISLILTIAVITLLTAILVPQVIRSLVSVVNALPGQINSARQQIDQWLANEPDLRSWWDRIFTQVSGGIASWQENGLMPVVGTVLSGTATYVTGFAVAVKDSLLGLIVTIYLLAARKRFAAQSRLTLQGVCPERWLPKVEEEVHFIDHIFHGFLLGKLLPYTVLFALLGSLLELLLFGWAGYPIKGSVGWMILAVTVMVLAYQSVAVFIISMVPTLRLSISIGSLYSVLGITFAGFTLPLTALPPALQGLSVIFPLRFYYQIYTREVIYGSGFAGWWVYLVCLLVFLILPYLSSHRLYNAYKYQNYPKD